MGTEDSPESVRRSTRTTSTPHDAENETGEKTDTPTEETNEAVETNLDTGDDGPTITMDGESLVGVLSYLDDPDSYPGTSEGLELEFDRDADTSQQNHVHEVFQVIHQVCKMADDSISIEGVELAPGEE
jgi:hypothetical protein